MVGFAEVSSALWRERELLELLLFKLEQQRLVRRSGRTRWLARATREVHIVHREIQAVELLELTAELACSPDLAVAHRPIHPALADFLR